MNFQIQNLFVACDMAARATPMTNKTQNDNMNDDTITAAVYMYSYS